MGTLRRLFDPNQQGLSLFDWLRRRRERHLLRIPDDAPILTGRGSSAAEIAAEHAYRRRELVGRHTLTTRDKIALAVLGVLILGGIALDAREAVLQGPPYINFGRSVTAAIVLGVPVLVMVWHSRNSSRGLQALPEQGRGMDTPAREKAVLDWLERHWPWPAPPELFEGRTADLQGEHRGRPFLVLSQLGERHEADWHPAMCRTCVLLCGHGSPLRVLPSRPVPAIGEHVRLAITPAGLFAYWPAASLIFTPARERWESVLDVLIDIADREGGQARQVGTPNPESAGRP